MSHYFRSYGPIEQRVAFLEPKLSTKEFVEEATSAMDMVGVEAIKSIFKCFAHLLPRICLSDPDMCRSSLQASLIVCYKFRRSDHFWSLMKHFAQSVFQSLALDQQDIRPQLFKFLSELQQHGENIQQLSISPPRVRLTLRRVNLSR